ncbi:hypothetical protein KTS45_01065 [Halomicroarcula limicola]|uniref:Uncharacterized protein n=1 Tax=Haloarcula limicola TaxID=1429915 RepID=A0A8J7Y6W3_9EURY|nr:hypothetical protein [Halomicroarcula limicola]MBV0922779.1 hypothetical protein [Halomicroarcula limicola]
MANRTNLLAGLCCLAGVAGLAVVFGPASLTAGLGAAVFAGSLALAGSLFLLASTERTLSVGGRHLDLHDCSGLGDIVVGIAIFGGLTGGPSGLAGVVYAALVVLGGLSAVLFGVVGLAEKYGRL